MDIIECYKVSLIVFEGNKLTKTILARFSTQVFDKILSLIRFEGFYAIVIQGSPKPPRTLFLDCKPCTRELPLAYSCHCPWQNIFSFFIASYTRFKSITPMLSGYRLISV